MNLLPKYHEEFSQKEYWDSFFKKRGSEAFEWYGEYPELCLHLHKYVKPKDDVLIVGCGNSTLGTDLFDVGYKKITSIDISEVAIRQMLQKNQLKPDLKFIQMDATKMTFDGESFSVVLDKGTLDALMTNEDQETIERINKFFDEICRVLTVGGRYICISLLQEHILKKVLSYFPSKNCMLRIVRLYEPEIKASEAGENSMPVFMVVATKFRELKMKILEVNMGSDDKMQRLQSVEDVYSLVTEVQKASFVCSGLRRGSVADQNEVSFDLFSPAQNTPRYTVYVIDVPHDRKLSEYAAFIVPQGREAEWLFSTPAGRKMLTGMTKHNRLAIVMLHRKQHYENLDAVQNEIGSIVKNLAPSTVQGKIPFLSVGTDVGKRIIRYEGHSELSGDYVVEDVEISSGEKFRRLYYMETQNIIQSEAKLKPGKSRKGSQKETVDTTYLTCRHHRYMIIGTHMACSETNNPSVVIVGLGGGGLCSFLRKYIPKASITGVDIDKDMLRVAKEWFGLQEDEKLKVHISDGIDFLKNTANSVKKYNAILFDVDSKDTTLGMSCPPKQFLEKTVLESVTASLDSAGLFMLNVVLRNESLRPGILENLKRHFPTIVSYKLEEDLNEVFICSLVQENQALMCKQFKESCRELNVFFKRKQMNNEVIEIEETITLLKINK